MGLLDTNPDRNWGVNVEANKKLAAESGYTGDFGGGGYQTFLANKAANPSLYSAPTGTGVGGPTDASGYVIPPQYSLTAEQNAQNAANGVRVQSSQFNPNDQNYIGNSAATTRNWGENVDKNKEIASQTGYTGNFGNGEFANWQKTGLLGGAPTPTPAPAPTPTPAPAQDQVTAAKDSNTQQSAYSTYNGTGNTATTINGNRFSPVQQSWENQWAQQYKMDPKLWNASMQAQGIPPPPSFTAQLSRGDLGAYTEYDPIKKESFQPKQAGEMVGGFRRLKDGERETDVQTYDEYRIGQGLSPIGGAAGAEIYGGGTGYWGNAALANATPTPTPTPAVTTPTPTPTPTPTTNNTNSIAINSPAGTVNNPEALHAMLRQQIGYTGTFGGGEFQQWLSQQSNEIKSRYNTVIGMPSWYTDGANTNNTNTNTNNTNTNNTNTNNTNNANTTNTNTTNNTTNNNTLPTDPEAQYLGTNPALNARLATELGYKGNFGVGEFQTWLAQQSPNVKADYAKMLAGARAPVSGLLAGEPGAITDPNDPAAWESRVWGENEATNRAVAKATGYTGNFGRGEYEAWAAQNPERAALWDRLPAEIKNDASQNILNLDALARRNVHGNETVAGQLDGLLSANSSYIQGARDKTMRAANSRGLLNSSIAASAGEEAAINAALPIAQADAATYGKASDYNVALENQGQMYNVETGNKFAGQRLGIEAEKETQERNIDANKESQATTIEANKETAAEQAKVNEELARNKALWDADSARLAALWASDAANKDNALKLTIAEWNKQASEASTKSETDRLHAAQVQQILGMSNETYAPGMKHALLMAMGEEALANTFEKFADIRPGGTENGSNAEGSGASESEGRNVIPEGAGGI